VEFFKSFCKDREGVIRIFRGLSGAVIGLEWDHEWLRDGYERSGAATTSFDRMAKAIRRTAFIGTL